ncbi:hypothetical protein E2562_010796 [Oryza meyeriana var. granulata]|uniref:Uncharacterized protein n=1 Tax=Oryza meyeriana var. granulata TaxID=110450 RepID=A0A6G1BK47_9ORYZ|nr:hypothetical protein E2562_010796 [Oryza meyeriana var. granulata]
MPLLGGGLPTCRRLPPLFLCRAKNLAGTREENCRPIIEILSRGRNPMLVGVGAAFTDDDFAAASLYRIIHIEPNSIDKLDLGVAVAMGSATSRAGGQPPRRGGGRHFSQDRRRPRQASFPPCVGWRL